MSYENNCLVKRLSHSFHPLYFQIRYLGKRYVFNSWHHFPRVLFFVWYPCLKQKQHIVYVLLSRIQGDPLVEPPKNITNQISGNLLTRLLKHSQ